MNWFKCDKGWLGVDDEHAKTAYRFALDDLYNADNATIITSKPRMSKLVEILSELGIDYETTTDKPARAVSLRV